MGTCRRAARSFAGLKPPQLAGRHDGARTARGARCPSAARRCRSAPLERMGAHRRAVAAVATYRRAVNVVRAVIEQKRSLESVWGNESKKLRPPDRRWFRDLCSGALRNWHRLDAELAPIVAKEAFLEGGKAKRGVDDPELRALREALETRDVLELL